MKVAIRLQLFVNTETLELWVGVLFTKVGEEGVRERGELTQIASSPINRTHTSHDSCS
jgi:hypothetical protein